MYCWNRKTGVVAVFCCSIVALMTSYTAHAETVADNISEITALTTRLDSDRPFGQAFTTGANGGTLSSIALALGPETGIPSVTVSLHPYSTTSFPSALAIVDSVTIGLPGTYTFTPSETVSLAPNTSYWIVARTDTGTALWDYTFSQTVMGTGSVPVDVTAARSEDNGASLSATFALADGPQQFAVVINPIIVPEAASVFLFLSATVTGVAGVPFARRKRL